MPVLAVGIARNAGEILEIELPFGKRRRTLLRLALPRWRQGDPLVSA